MTGYVEMNKNGTVTLPFGGTLGDVTLRMPTIGELKKIRTECIEINVGIQKVVEAARKEIKRIKQEDDPTMSELRFEDDMSVYAQWWIDIITVLGDQGKKKLLTIEDFPAWSSNPQLPSQVVAHFRAVPTQASG